MPAGGARDRVALVARRGREDREDAPAQPSRAGAREVEVTLAAAVEEALDGRLEQHVVVAVEDHQHAADGGTPAGVPLSGRPGRGGAAYQVV